MSLKAWLGGEETDLRYLADTFPQGKIWIGQEGDRFYLSAWELNGLRDDASLLPVVRDLLDRLNGLAGMLNPGFRPAQITGSFSEDGKPNFALKEFTLDVRPGPGDAAGIAALSSAPSDPAAYAQLVHADKDLAEAVALMGRPHHEQDWSLLYKVLEIIEGAGVIHDVLRAAGVSKPKQKLFTRTANHQAASGPAARHARLREQPPKNPMSIEEARSMIRQLLVAWMHLVKTSGL